MDWVYLLVGQQQLLIGSIDCIDGKYLVVIDNKGSIILLLYTIVTYLYPAVMLYAFYYIPKRSGLVVGLKLDGAEIKIESLDYLQQHKSLIDSE
jgi:hypothetical protein